MNNEFWMPRPHGEPAGFFSQGERLSAAEQAVLKRLRRREPPRRAARRTTGAHARAVLRRRRRALDRLAPEDLRRLARIVMELGL